MHTISVRRTTATLAAVVAGLAATVTVGGTTTPAAATTRHEPQRTSLTLVVHGCDGCSIMLQHAIAGGDSVWTSHLREVGPDHRIGFRIPTRRTHGLSFVLRAPWAGNIGAVPNLVTRYAGHAPGSAIDRQDARHGRRAEGCWAGTQDDRARLRFRVDRVSARTVDGKPTHIPLAYSPHTLPSWKPMLRTYKGTIGNQDALYCERPAQ